MKITDLLEQTKAHKKCIIGMVHCLPLPGTLHYSGQIEAIYTQAIADARTLAAAGVSAIIVENTNDLPYAGRLESEQLAVLAAVTRTVVSEVTIPVGVDASFNDGAAAISIACAAGAQFIRAAVFVDSRQVTGAGVIEPCAKELLRHRRLLGAEDIRIFADAQVKHSHPLVPTVTLEESCRIAADYGADALIITGVQTGAETPLEALKRAKAVSRIPVLIGSGLNIQNVKEQLTAADGAIVGSALKEQGNTANPVNMELTRNLMEEVFRVEADLLSVGRIPDDGKES